MVYFKFFLIFKNFFKGRTHRSNQESAPEYLFLISELAGEKRFASIVAKRLESLGALTQGDRRATESRDLSQFNIDNTYGREALNVLLRTLTGACEHIVQPPKDYDSGGDFFKDMQIYLEGVGMVKGFKNFLKCRRKFGEILVDYLLI